MNEDRFIEDFFKSGTIISCSQDRLIIGWGKRKWLEEPDISGSSPSFYFPDFFLKNSHAWFTHEHEQEISIADFLAKIAPYAVETVSRLKWDHPDKAFYAEQFEILQKLFAETTLEKAVPFVYDLSPTAMTPSLLFHTLASGLTYMQSHPVHLYGFWENGEGMLGATPELLFTIQINDNRNFKLISMALGGTLVSQANEKSGKSSFDALIDEKLLHEHQVIVEGIRESLNPFGKVKTGQLHLIQLGKLSHLRTDVEVDLKYLPRPMELVKALHPTPALGSFPREAGKKWLDYYQTLIDRRRFGAPVGYLWKEKNETLCYVAIRNIQWTSQQIMVAAGGGVVQESQLHTEWEEIISKIESIKNIFQI